MKLTKIEKIMQLTLIGFVLVGFTAMCVKWTYGIFFLGVDKFYLLAWLLPALALWAFVYTVKNE